MHSLNKISAYNFLMIRNIWKIYNACTNMLHKTDIMQIYIALYASLSDKILSVFLFVIITAIRKKLKNSCF